MESSELNQSSADDSRLEACLRASSATPPLPDDGFTARVLAALPPAASAWREERRRSLRRRWWFCLGGAMLGGAVSLGAGGTDLGRTASALLPPFATVARQLATPSLGLAVAAIAVSLVVAFWPELARRARRLQ